MTAFAESLAQTLAGSVVAAERRQAGGPRNWAKRLLRKLAGKKNILVTTHQHPDPDAMGSALALTRLLESRLGNDTNKPTITLATSGRVGGGVNETFLRVADGRLKDWEQIDPLSFDAVVLLDTQPQFSFSPLPSGLLPTAVIDHHRGRGRKSKIPLWDVRTEVGATCSIVFSYFAELQEPIPPDLSAAMLYAIESDLAGAAGTPGDLDNLALSNLTLTADPRKLYQMRFTPLPQSYYRAYAQAIANAEFQQNALISHLDSIDSMEQPAIMADFLLRFDQAEWALVTAVVDDRIVLSLRTRSKDRSAADVMRRLLRCLGEGGGHRTKAGGFVSLTNHPTIDIARLRRKIWQRYLRAVGLKPGKPQKLV